MRFEVFDFALIACLGLKNFLFRRREHAIETAQDSERQYYILIFASFEGVADQIRDTPEKADDFAMVHLFRAYLSQVGSGIAIADGIYAYRGIV